MLCILLLGTPAVSFEDVPVHITRKLQRALLFYLAARGGPVGREELIGLFWPEEDDVESRRHLREALSKLRASLPDRSLLVTNTHQVSLDFHKVYVDVLEFRTLLGQAGAVPWEIPSQRPLPETLAQALEKALRLWRSPRFMDGANLPDSLDLENWHSMTHQELEIQYQRLAGRLADHALARGELETALKWLLLMLQVDPIDEQLNGRVLHLLVDMGRRTAAINFFNHLKDIYQRDLNLPLPRTILDEFGRLQTGREPELRGLPDWPVTQGIQSPLVGRDSILKDLQMAFNRGGTAIILGEAGAGKTRLVQEVYQSLDPAPRLMLAAAHPLEGSLPFQAVIEVLRLYVTADDWRKLPVTWGRQIASLLPEIQVICPEFETYNAVLSDQSRPLLFESIRQLLLQVAQKRRLFLFLDDAQWADETSLLFLAFLLQRNFFNTHGLLVITARAEEHRPHLEMLFNVARRAAACHEVFVPLLGKQEVFELASHALGQPASPALVEKLVKDTGGNPLIILMTVHALLESNTNSQVIQAPDTLPMASGIHILLRERLSGVHPHTRQFALTAAVVGNSFELDVVARASQMSDEAIAQAVEELEKRQLIQEVRVHQSGHILYTFIHDKIREELLLELSPVRKRMLHQRVAYALEVSLGKNAGQQAAFLAQHYEAAGEAKKAFDWWLQAAHRARQLFSNSEAENAFIRAERLAQNLDRELDDDQIYQLYSRWGEMIYESHGSETLSRVYTTLLRQGEQRQSSLLVGTALSGLCTAALTANDLDKSLEYANQAQLYLERSGNLVELIRAHNRRGLVLSSANRYPEALSAFEQALAVNPPDSGRVNPPDSGRVNPDCQRPDFLQARATAQHEIIWIYYSTGWPERAIEYARNVLKEAPFFLQHYNQMRFYTALVLPNTFTGHYAIAQENYQKGIELARKLQSWRFLNYLQVFASQNELALGNLDASLEYATQAEQLTRQYEVAGIVPAADVSIGKIYQLLYDPDRAIRAYQRGLEIAQDSYDILEISYQLGLCLAMTGQVAQGLAMIEGVITRSEARDLGSISILARTNLAMLYATIGEKEKARQQACQVIDLGQRRAFNAAPLMAGYILGDIARSEGDTATARHYAKNMIEQPRRPGDAFAEIYGLTLMLRTLRQEKQSDAPILQRLIQRLDDMQAHAQHPEILPLFKTYRQKLLTSL
jgi:DNA-binding SARP family transcriptional activator